MMLVPKHTISGPGTFFNSSGMGWKSLALDSGQLEPVGLITGVRWNCSTTFFSQCMYHSVVPMLKNELADLLSCNRIKHPFETKNIHLGNCVIPRNRISGLLP
jgi:hypothetical protein